VDEVVVVNDGSTDTTAQVVSGVPGVCLVNLPLNCGKGGAMWAGAQATDADLLVFLDADLMGLKAHHVDDLVEPVKTGKYRMSVGRFGGGRKLTDLAQKVMPHISGQRCIRRDVFEQIPDLEYTRFGVEWAITRFCHHYRVPATSVLIPGVTHPMKEEKLGVIPGFLARARMYSQILRIMMDPRAPRRRPRRGILRKAAALERLNGRASYAANWLYRQEKTWRKSRALARRKR
jgi:glycosyltransferase involved in cell wall biosynthesis